MVKQAAEAAARDEQLLAQMGEAGYDLARVAGSTCIAVAWLVVVDSYITWLALLHLRCLDFSQVAWLSLLDIHIWTKAT